MSDSEWRFHLVLSHLLICPLEPSPQSSSQHVYHKHPVTYCVFPYPVLALFGIFGATIAKSVGSGLPW